MSQLHITCTTLNTTVAILFKRKFTNQKLSYYCSVWQYKHTLHTDSNLNYVTHLPSTDTHVKQAYKCTSTSILYLNTAVIIWNLEKMWKLTWTISLTTDLTRIERCTPNWRNISYKCILCDFTRLIDFDVYLLLIKFGLWQT